MQDTYTSAGFWHKQTDRQTCALRKQEQTDEAYHDIFPEEDSAIVGAIDVLRKTKARDKKRFP